MATTCRRTGRPCSFLRLESRCRGATSVHRLAPEQTDLSVIWCCVLFSTIATISSNRCASASAWKLEFGTRSPALAFSSSIPFSRSTKLSGCVHPRSTVKLEFAAITVVMSTGRSRLLHLQPYSRQAGTCGLKRSANLAGLIAVRQTGGFNDCKPHDVQPPPCLRIVTLPPIDRDSNVAKR